MSLSPSIHSKDKDDNAGQVESIHTSTPLKRNTFRTTFTQATILGICSFLAPGICESVQISFHERIVTNSIKFQGGAMAACGGGGTQSVSVSINYVYPLMRHPI